MIKFKFFGIDNKPKTAAAGNPQPETGSPSPAPANPNGKHVLIVDDDPVFLQAASARLLSAGFQVRTATEGPGAIAALGESPADVILMDINFEPDVANGGMGGWDGFQTLTWLRGLPGAKGARFIMVSVTDSEAYRQRARKLGAAYFPKPVEFDQLLAVANAQN